MRAFPTFAHFGLVISSYTAAQLTTSNTTSLTATALVTDANNNTAFQCWQLTEPFKTSSTPGQVGTKALTIGDSTNLAYTVLPPRFDGGIHNAPEPQ